MAKKKNNKTSNKAENQGTKDAKQQKKPEKKTQDHTENKEKNKTSSKKSDTTKAKSNQKEESKLKPSGKAKTLGKTQSKSKASDSKDVSAEGLSKTFNRENFDNLQADLKKLGGFEGLAKKLSTDLKSGLKNNENFEKRQEKFGANVFPQPPAKTFFEFMLDSLSDRTLQILIVSALISLALGIYENPKSGWIEGAAILFAVIIVVLVTAINDYSKQKQFRKLSEINSDIDIKVVRDGKQKQISIKEINVGDIVQLETGDSVPADGVVFAAHSLRIDESEVTGEPEPVKKKPDDNFFLTSGTQVSEGDGEMLITAVGEFTERGNLRSYLIGPTDPTPLQHKLETVADTIGYIGLLFAVLTFTALVGEYGYKAYLAGKSFESHMIGDITHFIITAITIVVVAVPEGLPLAVTLSLAYSMQKMLKDGNLVRHLHACETMGGATNICSDKTGTLTENQMTVTKIWIAEQEIELGEDEDVPEELSNMSDEALILLTEGVSINSKAYLTEGDDGRTAFIGSKTEGALLVLAQSLGSDYQEIRDTITIGEMFPFSSEKKRMSTVVKSDEGYRLYTKGASEMVLDNCTSFMNEDGSTSDLTEELREKIKEDVITSFAKEGLRTLCLAYAHLESCPSEEPEVDLVCIAIVGIKDPLRKEVAGAVKDCRKAGIFVRMVTGDNILTATKIAEECNILTKDGLAMEGPEFRKLSDEELDSKLEKLQVLARSLPIDKYRLVKRLRDLGEVVAVTGDGSNDAPALKEADVGFSMGMCGTEVAKEASDIVLLDDNFSNIVKAVMWGRNVYDSIRKFLQFQLTVNLVALIVAFVSALRNGESVLSPVQLLWVNLIMDTLGALALATDVPTPDLLNRKPHGRKDPLITASMWLYICGQALYQVTVLFTILFFGEKVFGTVNDNELTTIIFNTFVLCQVVNEINSRRYNLDFNVFSGIQHNLLFIGILIFTVVTQIFIVNFGGSFTKTVPISINHWLICTGFALLGFPIGLLLRVIARLCLPNPEPSAKDPIKDKHFKGKAKSKSKSKKKKTDDSDDEEEEDEKPLTKAQKKKKNKNKKNKVEDKKDSSDEEEEEDDKKPLTKAQKNKNKNKKVEEKKDSSDEEEEEQEEEQQKQEEEEEDEAEKESEQDEEENQQESDEEEEQDEVDEEPKEKKKKKQKLPPTHTQVIEKPKQSRSKPVNNNKAKQNLKQPSHGRGNHHRPQASQKGGKRK